MMKSPKGPASDTTPGPSAFERMRDLTRRIVRVSKAEVEPLKPKPRARSTRKLKR